MSWLIERLVEQGLLLIVVVARAPTPKSDNTLTHVLAYKGQVLWAKAERLWRARNRTNIYWMGKAPSRVSRRVQDPSCQMKVLPAHYLCTPTWLDVPHTRISILLNSTCFPENLTSHIWPVSSIQLDQVFRLNFLIELFLNVCTFEDGTRLRAHVSTPYDWAVFTLVNMKKSQQVNQQLTGSF